MIPGSSTPLLLAGAAEAAAADTKSLRFNSGDSAYLSRTPASAGNRRTWTWSGWVKRSSLGVTQHVFGVTGTSDSTYAENYFASDDKLYLRYGYTSVAEVRTQQVFRDASAWYHLVIVFDATQATDSLKLRLYVNGDEVTAFSTDTRSSLSNTDYGINNNAEHVIGGAPNSSTSDSLSAYLADVIFVDGQALTPGDFAEADATTGQWVPKEYTFSTPLTIQVGTPTYPSDFTSTGDKTSDQTGLSFGTWSGSYTGAETKIFKASDDSVFEFNLSLSGGSTDRYLWYSDNLNDWTYIGNTNPNRYYRLTGHKYYATSEGSGSTTLYAKSDGFASFHLDFSDATSTTTIAEDSSGQNNDWTANNISVTAGAGNDSLFESPSTGTQSGNYCTWNPLKGAATNSNGNLDASTTTGGSEATVGTIGVSSGKWYWEVALTVTGTSAATIGIATNSFNATNYVGNDAGSWGYYSFDGSKYNNGSGSSYGSTYGDGDVIGVAFDADNGSLYFYKNGTIQNSGTAAYTGLTSGPYFPAVGDASSGGSFVFTLNAGQRAFAYTAPSGFKALCTTNLPDPTITAPSDYMDVALYTGNGTADGVTQTITGLSMSPDLVWIKSRSNAYSHNLYDVVRGAGEALVSNAATAETTTNALTQFTSDGFIVKRVDSGPYYETNANNATYAAWTFDGGSSFSNSAGTNGASLASSGVANQDAGFSIVSYTSDSTSNQTVGHGLNAAPSLILVKNRDDGGDPWAVWHKDTGKDKYLYLNTTDKAETLSQYWGSAEPTPYVFGVGAGLSNNRGTDAMIAYCWAPVEGYSAFGSYTGSTDLPFIYTGFKVKYLLAKRSSAAGDWIIQDVTRTPSNGTGDNNTLVANVANSEDGYYTAGQVSIDYLSNGFKLRHTGGPLNDTGSTYIWAAFSESPFKFANAR